VIQWFSGSQELVESTKTISLVSGKSWALNIIGVSISTAKGSSRIKINTPFSLYVSFFSLSF